jgi:hypothetical protein
MKEVMIDKLRVTGKSEEMSFSLEENENSIQMSLISKSLSNDPNNTEEYNNHY